MDADSILFSSTLNFQLYANNNFNTAWSDVSTVISSVENSGPIITCNVFTIPGIFGVLPDNDNYVNTSSGSKLTSAGPNTILVFFVL